MTAVAKSVPSLPRQNRRSRSLNLESKVVQVLPPLRPSSLSLNLESKARTVRVLHSEIRRYLRMDPQAHRPIRSPFSLVLMRHLEVPLETRRPLGLVAALLVRPALHPLVLAVHLLRMRPPLAAHLPRMHQPLASPVPLPRMRLPLASPVPRLRMRLPLASPVPLFRPLAAPVPPR
jgi:hypothetical protein